MTGFSVICVYNDEQVRQRCLDLSLEMHRHEGVDVEFLPVDNVDNSFTSAGAAMNHAASLARHDYLVFVHQDVYLHSLRALQQCVDLLALAPDIGMVGAIGVSDEGRPVGRVRDRVVLLGQPAGACADVDSLDEVLFVLRRADVLQSPLVESSDLAWHAYAVEYGLRMRSRGRRVVAFDIPLTHNSLTINLDRLEAAHEQIALRYADLLPVQTTCGTVRRTGDGGRLPPVLRRRRWRYTWAKESLEAWRVRRVLPTAEVVLSDIRRDVDEVLAGVNGRGLRILNLAERGESSMTDTSVELLRRHHRVRVEVAELAEIVQVLEARRDPQQPLLLTNLTLESVRRLAGLLGQHPVLGLHGQIGLWALLGAAADVRPEGWGSARARPLRLAKRLGSPQGQRQLRS